MKRLSRADLLAAAEDAERNGTAESSRDESDLYVTAPAKLRAAATKAAPNENSRRYIEIVAEQQKWLMSTALNFVKKHAPYVLHPRRVRVSAAPRPRERRRSHPGRGRNSGHPKAPAQSDIGCPKSLHIPRKKRPSEEGRFWG